MDARPLSLYTLIYCSKILLEYRIEFLLPLLTTTTYISPDPNPVRNSRTAAKHPPSSFLTPRNWIRSISSSSVYGFRTVKYQYSVGIGPRTSPTRRIQTPSGSSPELATCNKSSLTSFLTAEKMTQKATIGSRM